MFKGESFGVYLEGYYYFGFILSGSLVKDY